MNATAITEYDHLVDLVAADLAALHRGAEECARAEHEYRTAKSQAWEEAPVGPVAQREAWVNGATADQRQRRDLAEADRQAAREAVRSHRAQLSSCPRPERTR